MKIRNILTSLTLVLALVIGGCLPLSVNAENEAEGYTPGAASGGMELICSKGALELYADMKNGEFSVKDNQSGKIWYSNPPDREDDEYGGSDRAKTFSQIVLNYIEDKTMIQGFVSSYEAEINEGITVTKNKNGFTALYKFFDLKIAIPLKITLTEAGFMASVDVTKIREDKDKKLLEIDILPFFGAGGIKDDGYIVVPDGCGALIEFNSGRQNMASYNEPVYGRDITLLGDTKTKIQENSAIPLFGIKNGDQGFAAIITEGDAVASVVAGVSKKGSGYNNAYTNFVLRSTGQVEISGNKVGVYEQTDSKVKACTVEYRLLTGENADYNGIAKTYSDYLLKNGLKLNKKDDFSMLLEVYGAVKVNRSVLGIPAKVTEPLTTFSQAGDMAEELKENGVEGITLLYNDYDRASVGSKLPKKISPIGKLGGKSGLKKLNRRLEKMDASLVSVVDLISYQSGAFKNKNSAYSLGGLPGLSYVFDLSTNKADKKIAPFYHLAPALFEKYAERFADKYNTERFGAIGLDGFATLLYSDFSKNQSSNRQQTLEYFKKGAKALNKGNTLYMEGGSAWAFEYADYIYDMPSDTSRTELESRAIPLYQLAVSGMIPYSLEAVNRSVEPEKTVLKCAEYGADIKYDLTHDSLGITGEPQLSYLDGTQFKLWSDYAADSYKRLSKVSDIISGRLLYHEQAMEDVFVSTFENGKIIVNYRDESVTVGSTTVEAKDFAVLKEAE